MTSYELGIAYGLTFLGAPYTAWLNGPLLENSAPAWAGNGPLPESEQIMREGMFCAGLLNLMLRKVGGSVPEYESWNGGTVAYEIRYKDIMVPFSLDHVKRGDILFRCYSNVVDQGHIAVALGGQDDPVLQACLPSGVNIEYSLKESHNGYYYTHKIEREFFWPDL